jgi:hypothetical protein
VVNRPPYLRVAKTLVKPDGGPIRLNLGPLQAGESYWLNVTVTQADGATLTPSNYQFEGLAAIGHANAPLRAMAQQVTTHGVKKIDPAKPAKHKRKHPRNHKLSRP